MIWWCWRKLPLLALFPFTVFCLAIILWLTDESQKLGQTFSVYYITSVFLQKWPTWFVTPKLLMVYSRKNPNMGSWGYTFLKTPPGICRLVILPLEIPKLSPLEILKNCLTPLGNYKIKNQDPWKFHKCFSLTPPEIPLLF